MELIGPVSKTLIGIDTVPWQPITVVPHGQSITAEICLSPRDADSVASRIRVVLKSGCSMFLPEIPPLGVTETIRSIQ